MKTLEAHREKKSSYNCVTTLKDLQGKVKAIITGYNQSTKRQKIITVQNKIYNLKFA